jgi:hypothetical protein
MNAQVIGRATKTALMETTRAGHRPTSNGCEEKEAMTRGEVFKPADAIQRRLWLLAMTLLIGALIAGAPGAASAQFTSGSTGTHGVFPPPPASPLTIPGSYSALVWNVRTGKVAYCSSYTSNTGLDVCDAGSSPNVEAQIPNIPAGGLTTGVYEFTDFVLTTVPGQFRTLFVVGTSPNTPLTILSANNIAITGDPGGYTVTFQVRGWDGRAPSGNAPALSVPGGFGGPGGFNGGTSGNGGITPSDGAPGFGPTGGAGGHVSASGLDFIATSAQASALNPSLSPLTGGSGGGGGAGVSATPPASCSNPNYAGGGGGGGGGALLLAATNKITIGPSASILAIGGQGGGTSNGCGYGGGGAGGNIRMVAQLIEGTGAINVTGGVRGEGSQRAAGGYVRFEAASNTYSGQISGAVGGSFVSFPTAPLPLNQPQLHISSIDGSQAPATPTGSLSNPDITFASAVNAPVTLTVTANNVPLGTTVSIRVAPAVGEPTTATSQALDGSFATSSATAQVTLPPGAGLISATATFNLNGVPPPPIAGLTGIRFDGELAQRMEVVTQPDGTSKTFVIARSGARFEIGTRQ